MSDLDKTGMIYDMVKGLGEESKKTGEEIAMVKANLIAISFTLQKNTDLLDEHIEGVNTLKLLHQQNVERITKLEEPGKVKEFVVRKTIWYLGLISAVAGATAAILRFFN